MRTLFSRLMSAIFVALLFMGYSGNSFAYSACDPYNVVLPCTSPLSPYRLMDSYIKVSDRLAFYDSGSTTINDTENAGYWTLTSTAPGYSYAQYYIYSASGNWASPVYVGGNGQSYFLKSNAGFSWQGDGFGGTAYPYRVFSPVTGALEAIGPSGSCSGAIWCFNQHQQGSPNSYHAAGLGIGHSDDSYAWDVNLNYPSFDSDNGQHVYAVAAGTVAMTYGGSGNAETAGSCHQVLIQHTFNGNTWWSGYLHMTDLQVSRGSPVTRDTYIDDISTSCTGNNHLHFVVYQGTNSDYGLVSFSPTFVTR